MNLKIAAIVLITSCQLHSVLCNTDVIERDHQRHTDFLPRVRSINVEAKGKRVISTFDGMCFTLKNGTDFNPRNATDLAKAIDEIALLHSPDFLTWIEDKSKTEKSQILRIVDPVPIKEHEMKSKVEALKTFNNAEQRVSESSMLLNALSNGSFIKNYALKGSKTVPLIMSKKVFWKSLDQLKSAKRRMRQQLMMLSNTTAVAIYMDDDNPCKECGLIENGYNFGNNMHDLIDGLMEGDWRASVDAGFHMLGDGLGILESLDYGQLTKYFPGADLTFTYVNVLLDITDLITGNLQGIDLALGIISLIEDVVSMVTTVIGMTLGPIGELVLGLVEIAIDGIFRLIKSILGIFKKDQIAHEKLNQLTSNIYLTPEERDREFQRFKNGEAADQYLIDLGKQKAGNNKLVDMIAEELTTPKMSSIRLYVAPALSSNNLLLEDSIADLRSRTTYGIKRWAPDQSAIGTCCPWSFVNQIECFPKADAGESFTTTVSNVYSCTNAVGVLGVWNVNATHDLIALSNGTDTAYASNTFPSIFSVGEGTNTFTGGNANDIFLITETSSRGTLKGGIGNDTLNIGLPDDFHQRVYIDLYSKTLNTGTSGNLQLQIESMEVVRGRVKKPETISPACDTMYIEGLQGNAAQFDEININAACDYALTILLESFTRVYIDQQPQGSITLNVSNPTSTPGSIDITIHPDSAAQNNVLLNFSLSSIPVPNFDQQLGKIDIRAMFSPTSQFLTISPVFSKDTGEMTNPLILFQDDVSLKVGLSGVFSLIRSISEQDQFQAEKWAQHVVYVNSSTKVFTFHGGPLNDTLVVQNLVGGGNLDGDGGKNTLVVGSSFGKGQQVKVDLIGGLLNVSGLATTQVTRFQTVVGRGDGEDVIIPNCETTLVDGQGIERSAAVKDSIEIHEMDCEYNLMTVVRQNTRIQNEVSGSKNSTFIYALHIAPNPLRRADAASLCIPKFTSIVR